MPLTSEEAFDLARQLRGAAVDIGNYRFKHWDELGKARREKLEVLEWDLAVGAMQTTTAGVGLALEEVDTSLTALRDATGKARKAIKTLEDVRKVIKVATALVGLAAAVASKDPVAVAKNAKKVYEIATEDA